MIGDIGWALAEVAAVGGLFSAYVALESVRVGVVGEDLRPGSGQGGGDLLGASRFDFDDAPTMAAVVNAGAVFQVWVGWIERDWPT